MTIYVIQGRYTEKAIKGFIAKPEDRAGEVKKLIKEAGGKMLAYYVTLGEYDFMVTCEGNDLKNIISALIASAASGGVSDLKTTVAMTSGEAKKAMEGAKKLAGSFRAAGA